VKLEMNWLRGWVMMCYQKLPRPTLDGAIRLIVCGEIHVAYGSRV